MSHFSADSPRQSRRGSSHRSGKSRLITIIVAAVSVVAIVVGGLFVAGVFNSDDYVGGGTGEVQFTIADGEYGDAIAINLAKADVVKSSKSFYNMLLTTKPEPVFTPGVYTLKLHMSNASASAALQDPANRVENSVVIPEGTTLKGTLQILAQGLKIPLADFQAAVATPTAYAGVPSQATTLEGFLFPATYKFSPGITASAVIKIMVANTIAAMDKAGIAVENRWKRIILASIIQKEMGPSAGDAAKIARVFYNRLDAGMNLGSDVTTCYGAGLVGKDCLLITQAALDDASNPYNTRKNPGYPIGPICNPGQVAIDAAAHPADGDWLFFVAINLKTGETVFSKTNAEHEAAVAKYEQWLKDNPGAY